MSTYDAWKQRSDRDENEQPELEQRDECGTCGGDDGSHDRQCPERDVFDPRGDTYDWSER